jgi:hypothetical protein
VPEINASVLKRFKFMMAGMAVFFSVLLPGALWYKGAQRSVAANAAAEISTALQERANVVAQSIGISLNLASNWLWENSRRPSNKASPGLLRRDLPYDVVTVFTHDRQFYDGYRSGAEGGAPVGLSAETSSLMFPADSALLDRAMSGRPVSGILSVNERPLLVSLQRLKLKAGDTTAGFIVVGNWLKSDQLNLSTANSMNSRKEAKLLIHSLSNDATIPAKVRSVIAEAQRNNGFFFELNRDAQGTLYSVMNDINGRPAFITELPWQAPWRTTGNLGFGIFFSISALAGVGTWALLILGDIKSRRRKRKFDGLSSLSADQLKVLVESFPGYAFAIKPNMQYLAVSHILAGVTGHEPAYFVGQTFGSIAQEECNGSYEKLFLELRDPGCWPRTANIDHKVLGLGLSHEFIGSAHFLAKQDLVLVILNDRAQSISNTELKEQVELSPKHFSGAA